MEYLNSGWLRAGILACVCLSALPAQTSTQADRPVWPEEGPFKWAPRPTTTEITANDLRTRLYQFADDSMFGRRIGEVGNLKGTDYIAREFERLGLKPGGDKGTWYQELPWGPTGFDRTRAQLIIERQPLAGGTDWIPATPVANAIGGTADLSNAPTVFAGRWNDSIPLDASQFRGRIAVFLGGPMATGPGRGSATPQRCDLLPDRFGAAAAVIADAARGRGGRGRGGRGSAAADTMDSRATAAGAVGLIFIGLENVSSTTIRNAFATRMALAPTTAPGRADPPAAIITSNAASRMFGRPVSELTVGQTGRPVTARWSDAWRPGAIPARNVIAILPGSDPGRAGEYVLVGAHNDHSGIVATALDHDSVRAVNTVTRRQGANDPSCIPTAEQQRRIDSMIAHARSIRPPRRDSIMNGADDDGSGSMVMLEIAERFAQEKPARSIIFISHQGEEGGLRGSRWFVDHPTVPLDKIVAAINMDMVGKGRVTEVKYGGPSSVQILGARRLSREFGDIIDSVNAVRSETMAIDRSWDVTANPMNRFCRSDQVNYVRKDVPVAYVSLGYSQDYHQVTDEPQYIDYDHAARLGRFVFDIMWAVAQRKDRPAIAGPDPAYPSC
ncbi:MAG TPA: M28 family peptidase [Gemmatimonadaceae bacterium]